MITELKEAMASGLGEVSKRLMDLDGKASEGFADVPHSSVRMRPCARASTSCTRRSRLPSSSLPSSSTRLLSPISRSSRASRPNSPS